MQLYKLYDSEFCDLIRDILDHDDVKKLEYITHHHFTNRLDHSLAVSYVSYRIAKKLKLDYRAVARAGLLHDFFSENRDEIKALELGSHNFVHPKIACENAKEITILSELEEDIILKHMFLVSKCGLPKFKESYIVTFVDKYIAMLEVSFPLSKMCILFLMRQLGRILPNQA